MAPIDDDDDLITDVGIEPLPAAERSEPARPYLIVLAGASVGEIHPLEGAETSIGRGASATIRLRDDSVSRAHARIVITSNGARVEDLGSANGTLLNAARVTNAELRDGDKIQVGASTIFKFAHHDSLEREFQRQMYAAALRDPLTTLFNKKHLLERLATELAFARRHKTLLSLILFDVDHFKGVNDSLGHLAGDHVLATLAATVRAILRTEDLFARYGGEEFAVVCRSTPGPAAGIVAERIRATVHRAPFAYEGRAIPLTVSLGVAEYPTVAAVDPAELIGAADEALYDAKRAGRNRVVLAR